MASAINRAFLRKWFPAETLPIFGIVGVAVGGASWYLYRLSQGSEVVWNRHSDWRPWNKIEQDRNIKLLSFNPDFWAKRKSQAQLEAAEKDGKRIVDAI